MSQNTWQKTKEAVTDFRKLLLCSKCFKLMSEPLCLGTCEHMFCKSCAGPCAGGECSVCSCPAWVKDIQINRQLSNITDLFRNLEALLTPTGLSATPPTEPCEAAEVSPIVQRKKKYRIWTSPRSHRIRCRVESRGEVSLVPAAPAPARVPPRPQRALFPPQDASVYNFPASSQDSGSSSPSRTASSGGNKRKRKPAKKTRVRQAVARAQMAVTRKQKIKLQLQVINQQWGIGTEAEAGAPEERPQERPEESEGGGDGGEREGKRPKKRVSFQSPDSPLPEDHPKENAPPSENLVTAPRSAMSDTGLLSGPSSAAPPESIKQPATPPKLSPCRTPKRARSAGGGAEPQRSPKRPRTSPGGGRRRPAASDGLSALSTPPPSPQALSSPRGSPGGSGREPGLSPGPSPAGGRRSRGRLSPGSPAFAKRNHKGETPLHLAAIKGDVEAVKRLLEQGADPNLKDNAGWTPLHEASNHGHVAVVEALILGGSLLNTPGYQNDSPLHDAVRNGHAAIAKLLLEHGASQSVLNMFGLRALDCAETAEMREILLSASERGHHPLNSPLSPPASLSKTGGCGQKDGRVTLLGSKLTQPQRRQLAQAARLLGARLADAFSSAVTHVVVAEGGVPTTLSTLQGILNGCWILRFSWVKACQQAGARAAEVEHEAGEGPQRSRFNRDNLLPRLFDGCFFFLLGSFRRPEKADLLKLIREGGGQVLSRQPKPDSDVTQTLSAAAYHAQPGSDQALCTQYILYEPQGAYRPSRVRLGKVWSAPASWLLDCISAFQLLPVPGLEPAPAP